MNDELKRILSRFLLVSVIISCLTLIASGVLTAKQRSEYNCSYTKYTLLSLEKTDRELKVEIDDKSYSLTLPHFRQTEEKQWLYLTPFSSLYFFGRCFLEVLK